MPRYTTTENKPLTSLRGVECIVGVYRFVLRGKTNQEVSGHAFSEKTEFSDTVEIC